jgi:hypothetical protein
VPVAEAHDARCVALGELGVVGDHDHQAVLRDLLEQLHHVLARHGVQGARGLVRQHDVRVVHQGAGDGHALHLPARKLAGPLVDLLPQTNALERLRGAAAPLSLAHARQGQRHLNVLEDGLVRNQVVTLEHEADAVVAVRVPVLGAKVPG